MLLRFASRRASWVALAGVAGVLAAGGCQILSGLNDLEEGPPTGSSTGMGGGTSSSSNASTSATMCPMPLPAGCPNAACTGDCQPGMPCAITCTGSACPQMLTCESAQGPALDCDFHCDGGTTSSTSSTGSGPPPPTACGTKTIMCPKSGRCYVTCDGPGACAGTQIFCGDGPCYVDCISGACSPDTTVHCGSNLCQVSCPEQLNMMGSAMPGEDGSPCSTGNRVACGAM